MKVTADGAVRDAGPADAAQLARIHVRSWQAAYRGLLPQEYLDRLDPADRAGRWRQVLGETDWSRGGVIVVTGGTGMAGFAAFGPARDADQDPARTGEVQAIYLLPSSWGRGYGRRLMSCAAERLAAAGFAQATLWVLASNARARRFYARAGWSPDGAAKDDDSRGFTLAEVRYRTALAVARPGTDRLTSPDHE